MEIKGPNKGWPKPPEKTWTIEGDYKSPTIADIGDKIYGPMRTKIIHKTTNRNTRNMWNKKQ